MREDTGAFVSDYLVPVPCQKAITRVRRSRSFPRALIRTVDACGSPRQACWRHEQGTQRRRSRTYCWGRSPSWAAGRGRWRHTAVPRRPGRARRPVSVRCCTARDEVAAGRTSGLFTRAEVRDAIGVAGLLKVGYTPRTAHGSRRAGRRRVRPPHVRRLARPRPAVHRRAVRRLRGLAPEEAAAMRGTFVDWRQPLLWIAVCHRGVPSRRPRPPSRDLHRGRCGYPVRGDGCRLSRS